MTDHFFAVLEGLDGSGKSEIARRLSDLLRASLGANHVLQTYEPHNPSAAGEFCRDVLARRITVSARTLALAFALNRADHHERVITPFMAAGAHRVVVCDRCTMSSLVYQSTGGQTIDDVWELNKAALVPDLTLFLDADPDTCYARIGARQGSDRELFEERLVETRAKYFTVIDLLRSRGQQIAIIDANGTVEQVLDHAIAALNQAAPAWMRLERIET